MKTIKLIITGIITISLALGVIKTFYEKKLNNPDVDNMIDEFVEKEPENEWVEVCDDVVVTVYNAKPSQCNSDVRHTASMFKLDLDNVASHKIAAMERTFMRELGLTYGDIIKIEGTHKGVQDGIYQIQDVMNKRFSGQHKVDILVPDSITFGGTCPGQFAKVYVLNNKCDSQKYLDLMAPQMEME